MTGKKISARSQVLLNKVARLHDPESRMLDDLPALVRELREHFESIESKIADVVSEWQGLQEIESWRRNAIVGSMPEGIRKAIEALLAEKKETP